MSLKEKAIESDPFAFLKEKAIESDPFAFPALGNQWRDRAETALSQQVKVVAGRDLSFLKVAEERIFAGAEAAELKKVLELLENAQGYSEVNLSYMVGRCR